MKEEASVPAFLRVLFGFLLSSFLQLGERSDSAWVYLPLEVVEDADVSIFDQLALDLLDALADDLFARALARSGASACFDSEQVRLLEALFERLEAFLALRFLQHAVLIAVEPAGYEELSGSHGSVASEVVGWISLDFVFPALQQSRSRHLGLAGFRRRPAFGVGDFLFEDAGINSLGTQLSRYRETAHVIFLRIVFVQVEAAAMLAVGFAIFR